MTNTKMNQNTKDTVDEIINIFRYNTVSKIAYYSENKVARTAIHAFVRAVYCYSRKVTPGSTYKKGKPCIHIIEKTGENACGYVIGHAVYKWLLNSLEPSLAMHDHSSGCSFLHERIATQEFMNEISLYLTEKIPNLRKDDCYIGMLRVTDYVEKVLMKYATDEDIDNVLYESEDIEMPAHKSILVYKIEDVIRGRQSHPVCQPMEVIFTNDDNIFEEKRDDAVVTTNNDDDDY